MLRSNFKIICFLLAFSSVSIISSSYAQNANSTLANLEKEMVSLVETVKPCVVTIYAEIVYTYPTTEGKQLLTRLGKKEANETFRLTNIGSGLIYDTNGYILTKKSVIQNHDKLSVKLQDCSIVEAEFVGSDARTDLALLKAAIGNIPATMMGNSDDIKAGSWITVVGNSYGVSPSVSFGMVNGIRDDGLLQLSINVSPGNTGSPVFDMHGRVIGILSGLFIPSGEFIDPYTWEPIGQSVFAYPVNMIDKIVSRIINYDPQKLGWIGVITDHQRCKDGIAKLTAVAQNGPADKAGLEAGDVVLGVRDFYLTSQYDLIEAIHDSKPGDKIYVTFKRNNRIETRPLVIGSPPLSNNKDLNYKIENNKLLTFAQLQKRAISLKNQPIALNKGESKKLMQRINLIERELRDMKRRLNQNF